MLVIPYFGSFGHIGRLPSPRADGQGWRRSSFVMVVSRPCGDPFRAAGQPTLRRIASCHRIRLIDECVWCSARAFAAIFALAACGLLEDSGAQPPARCYQIPSLRAVWLTRHHQFLLHPTREGDYLRLSRCAPRGRYYPVGFCLLRGLCSLFIYLARGYPNPALAALFSSQTESLGGVEHTTVPRSQ